MGNEHQNRTALLQAAAGRCVACGLCLPHCPTYRESRLEAESPRGRIALARGLAAGTLEASAKLASHLSSCTQCRACERVCPAKVAYGSVIDEALALASDRGRLAGANRRLRNWLDSALATPGAASGRLLTLYRRSGLRSIARIFGFLGFSGLARADALLPPAPVAAVLRPSYAPEGPVRGTVALFTGCVNRTLDGDTLYAAIHVLNRLGFEVRIPKGQACCGALSLHEGAPDRARARIEETLACFAGEDVDAVISIASGCGATLVEYGKLLPVNPAARPFADRVRDINGFLADAHWPDELEPEPFPKRVAVQDPCTLRNVLREEQSVYRLLQRIPDIELVPLPENALCCGGAGTYPLREPELAGRMGQRKLDHVRAMQPDLLVSANIGCGLHLGGTLRKAGLPVSVLHPVVLLAQQLGWRRGS
jgi:glycolate oxidase iron-sulfur subunit